MKKNFTSKSGSIDKNEKKKDLKGFKPAEEFQGGSKFAYKFRQGTVELSSPVDYVHLKSCFSIPGHAAAEMFLDYIERIEHISICDKAKFYESETLCSMRSLGYNLPLIFADSLRVNYGIAMKEGYSYAISNLPGFSAEEKFEKLTGVDTGHPCTYELYEEDRLDGDRVSLCESMPNLEGVEKIVKTIYPERGQIEEHQK
jgi:hypothetical protein